VNHTGRKNGMDNCIDPRDDRADWDDLLVDTTLRRYRCSENARRLDTQQKIVDPPFERPDAFGDWKAGPYLTSPSSFGPMSYPCLRLLHIGEVGFLRPIQGQPGSRREAARTHCDCRRRHSCWSFLKSLLTHTLCQIAPMTHNPKRHRLKTIATSPKSNPISIMPTVGAVQSLLTDPPFRAIAGQGRGTVAKFFRRP
jgi:hypothetical protein